MLAQVVRHRPAQVALADAKAARELAAKVAAEGLGCEVRAGLAGVAQLAAGEAATVVAAIGGIAGVEPVMAAAKAGKRVLLANKESLVTAGRHMLEACRQSQAELVPIDSEHGALLELLHLARDRRERIQRVWLTASGGPFHARDIDFAAVSPQMATAHPVWEMGQKISVDSATLMNKGLEVIEASLLFAMPEEMIKVVVHPQGVVHALVDFADGGTLAHCARPDMRHAIARALDWPAPSGLAFAALDWPAVGRLDFLPPDTERFPCLRLALEALRTGGAAPAILNAANEVAVTAFCARQGVGFADIPPIVEDALAKVDAPAANFEDMVAADRAARAHAHAHIKSLRR